MISPVLAAPSFMLDGIFIGATRTRDMRNMMILSAGGFALAAWALPPVWGNHGLWAAMMLFYVLRSATLGARYPALERAAG
jgi:MATE family multidrug resistance protein